MKLILDDGTELELIEVPYGEFFVYEEEIAPENCLMFPPGSKIQLPRTIKSIPFNGKFYAYQPIKKA